MQGKTDVLLEIHVDDTTRANEVCSGSTHIFRIANEVLVDLIWIHVPDTVDLSLMNH